MKSYINNGVKQILETKPSNHFGEASKKLQSLFFMLRDNSDVFNLFCAKAHTFNYITDTKFTETLVNFLFRDLTQS
jgi:hypothetical protein